MENDDGARPNFGVVVSLLPLDDGTVRIILDDVRSTEPKRKTAWHFDCFYTHKRLNSNEAAAMALPDAEYQGLGEAVMARLLALNGLVK
jgi:hypothetical protein